MLEGWYCRSVANETAPVQEEARPTEESKFKKEYKNLKRKFQNLVFENESFKQALRSSQKRLLGTTRDRCFLLDRLLMYEKHEPSSSESDDTDSSDDGEVIASEKMKRRRELPHRSLHHVHSGKVLPVMKKRRIATPRFPKHLLSHAMHLQMPHTSAILSDGHMTPEEVERHLQSQSFLEFVPERAPPTVPTEMFSNEPSLDSESNDIGEMETSPSNMGEELSIDMIQD